MNSPVKKIKQNLGIQEVISSYIKLDPAGSNLKAKCPFHNEKTPSFFVSPSRGSFYCFGCGASGDIFTFVEEFEGLDFKGALKLLANRAGVVLETFNPKEESEKEKLYRAMEEATSYFENNLRENRKVLDYLKERGLTDKSIKDFRLGFAKDDWRLLYSYLKNKEFSDSEIEKAGLIKYPLPTSPKGGGEEGEKPFPLGRVGRGYDRFRGRIMFPIADTSGRVIAFSGRIFTDDGKSAKYLNSPNTVIFNKFAVLYGLDKAKESIRKNNFSILVEGQMDLVLSHQAGYRNTVATSGTALSDATVSKENLVSNLGLICRLSPNIVLAFDADRAGFNASNRAGRIALSLGMDVKVVSMPESKDPADLICQSGVATWRDAIKNSKHIIEFLLDKILKSFSGDTRKAGREIKEKLLPYVDALSSSIEKMHFVKKISDQSAIPESALQDDLKKIEQELKYEKKEIEEAQESLDKVYRKDYILRKLLGIILWQKNKKEKNADVAAMLKEIAEILNITEDQVLKKTEENKEDLLFEAEVFYGGDTNLEKDLVELLSNLREEALKEELFKKMQELRVVEEKKPDQLDGHSGGDTDKISEVLKQINEINNKIQNLKNNRLKK